MKPESFESSRAAYYWCVENGVISQRVAEVLKALVDDGAMNQSMVHHAVTKSTGNVSLRKDSLSPRFAVLERMGLIRNIGRNSCPFTGRSTVFYEATTSAPVCTEQQAISKAEKRETVATLKQALAEKTKECNDLREMLNLRSASFREREQRKAVRTLEVQTSFL